MVSKFKLSEFSQRSVILRELPWRWIVLWLILPHFAIVAMLPLGGPPMTWLLAVSIPAVAIAAQLPWRTAKAVILLILTTAITGLYISSMFNLGPMHMRMLPALFADVRPLHSPEYLAGAILAACSVYGIVRHAPRVGAFRTPMTWMLAALAGMGFIALEYYANADTRGSYRNAPGEGAVQGSASQMVGLFDQSPARRHLVIILVEALGVPQGGEEARLFKQDWQRTHWAQRYDIETGTVPYYGSTTNAELRELCDAWGQFASFPFETAQCLPDRYRAAGYDTLGIHGFYGDFFDRRTWYPRLGLSDRWFREELDRAGVTRCGGMFDGACDAEIPARIAARLKSAQRPQFVYWLTLNTHIPVTREIRMGTDRCDLGTAAWRADNPHLCRLFAVHRQLADAIDAMAMDRDLPPTDILIVGDHVPPFFDRASRTRFDGANVPWIWLSHRSDN